MRLRKWKVGGPCPVPPNVTVSGDSFTPYVFQVAPKNDRLLHSGRPPLKRYPKVEVGWPGGRG